MKNKQVSQLFTEEGQESILVSHWLQLQEADEIIEESREMLQPELPAVSAFQTREVKEISQKLNRLQRNFFREREVKKQPRMQQTASSSILELDGLYQQAIQLIAAIKLKKKQENKDVVNQLIRLYNHSAVELTKRQKVEKEIKMKKMKLANIQYRQEIVEQERVHLERELELDQAQHWIKMKNFEKMAALRQ